MATLITKNSSTAAAVPGTGDLVQGELAVNVTDKKLYTKDSGGSIVKVVGSLGNQEANAVAVTGGSITGTSVSGSTGSFTTLAASSTVSGTGFSNYLASPPAIGGSTPAAGSFTTVSASSSVTLSAGTANGIAYLNGSKVVTSGSALTFDGTNLATTGTATAGSFIPSSSTAPSNGMYLRAANTLSWATNGAHGLSLLANGELWQGTTTDLGSKQVGFISTRRYNGGGASLFYGGDASGVANAPTIYTWNPSTSGDSAFAQFATEATFTARGSIDYNRAGGLVRYNTTSDYRAKDIIGPVQNTGATIDALKVYEGVMKGATQSRPMLIAHEAQEHAPYAVSGVKDEVNEDGTPKFQQIDVSSLVPLLLAEIQSLRSRVAALEAA